MADDAVYDAIKDFLSDEANVAGLAIAGIVPRCRFENEDFAPDARKPWYSMSLSGVIYGQQSIGAETQAENLWEETGKLWLIVFVESDTGASVARRLAKKLADLFRGLTLLDDSLEFMDTHIGMGTPSDEDGVWFELPVQIDWRRLNA